MTQLTANSTSSETNFSHSSTSLNSFAPRLLDWFAENGRHDLPWQQHQTDTPNPYIVWLSEVMLQQTQVTTVLPYFARFMASFPTVQDLAAADWDTVAEHWAGLGYYARARNLHKGAKQLVEVIAETGEFPQTLAGWEAISGVGPSTAGAIMAMGLHHYGVICDGNVKRVITRWAAIDGDITKSATTKELWALAEHLTPTENSGLFAQAMMDMGATLCTRSKPACLLCPLKEDCLAHAQGRETDYPVKAKKQPKPSKFSNALLVKDTNGDILWLQRPDNGIWGGLWSLPLQFVKKIEGKVSGSIAKKAEASDDKPSDVPNDVRSNEKVYEAEFTTAEQIINEWLTKNKLVATPIRKTLLDDAPIKHSLTHFHWYLTPQSVTLNTKQTAEITKALQAADININWLNADDAQATLGLPRAMVKILE
ncbi:MULTISPECIES: A/G-specific adenine glycosylase [unclassified Psychrobacter]|uniref:A/G-specific adenine glycosylase n=1 Tax=unclassified Psychrobacter TaxID=196806 RepID=UPI0025B5E51F|nr:MULTISPECIES: A/G-specific adenine glycosylase [unclassified Psychrobacter]MDN3452950.1 A/G-specific adenine glycosylase [Psychrobacter sp. APC 3350]MDN3503002.1 A/G-specific adenine glycosylase [Psychrobacter sp. 5A.1]